MTIPATVEKMEQELVSLRAAGRRIKELEAELSQYKASAPLCEEHKPNGGARATCLVCACIKLSAAIDRIDYACGEPNEMEVSGYTIHCNEDVVVENVQKLKAERDALKADAERLEWMQDNPEHESAPYFDGGKWHIPYLVSGAGGSGAGVGTKTFDTLRAAIDAAREKP